MDWTTPNYNAVLVFCSVSSAALLPEGIMQRWHTTGRRVAWDGSSSEPFLAFARVQGGATNTSALISLASPQTAWVCAYSRRVFIPPAALATFQESTVAEDLRMHAPREVSGLRGYAGPTTCVRLSVAGWSTELLVSNGSVHVTDAGPVTVPAWMHPSTGSDDEHPAKCEGGLARIQAAGLPIGKDTSVAAACPKPAGWPSALHAHAQYASTELVPDASASGNSSADFRAEWSSAAASPIDCSAALAGTLNASVVSVDASHGAPFRPAKATQVPLHAGRADVQLSGLGRFVVQLRLPQALGCGPQGFHRDPERSLSFGAEAGTLNSKAFDEFLISLGVERDAFAGRGLEDRTGVVRPGGEFGFWSGLDDVELECRVAGSADLRWSDGPADGLAWQPCGVAEQPLNGSKTISASMAGVLPCAQLSPMVGARVRAARDQARSTWPLLLGSGLQSEEGLQPTVMADHLPYISPSTLPLSLFRPWDSLATDDTAMVQQTHFCVAGRVLVTTSTPGSRDHGFRVTVSMFMLLFGADGYGELAYEQRNVRSLVLDIAHGSMPNERLLGGVGVTAVRLAGDPVPDEFIGFPMPPRGSFALAVGLMELPSEATSTGGFDLLCIDRQSLDTLSRRRWSARENGQLQRTKVSLGASLAAVPLQQQASSSNASLGAPDVVVLAGTTSRGGAVTLVHIASACSAEEMAEVGVIVLEDGAPGFPATSASCSGLSCRPASDGFGKTVVSLPAGAFPGAARLPSILVTAELDTVSPSMLGAVWHFVLNISDSSFDKAAAPPGVIVHAARIQACDDIRMPPVLQGSPLALALGFGMSLARDMDGDGFPDLLARALGDVVRHRDSVRYSHVVCHYLGDVIRHYLGNVVRHRDSVRYSHVVCHYLGDVIRHYLGNVVRHRDSVRYSHVVCHYLGDDVIRHYLGNVVRHRDSVRYSHVVCHYLGDVIRHYLGNVVRHRDSVRYSHVVCHYLGDVIRHYLGNVVRHRDSVRYSHVVCHYLGDVICHYLGNVIRHRDSVRHQLGNVVRQ
ncbi:hypothetical protein FNF31_04250 [Cafeteria roenbergensis]|uniref:Uncharacterized protein n=1 Tax=Cafeteria roenbergensis TaxID=33653 RepID=A0A5A8D9F7_CAFRO|nr:hypothetical protein FNF31_04250 [Cafeteria roenbergensis]